MAGLFTVTSSSTKNISIGQLDEFMDWAVSNGGESMTPAQALSVPLAFRAVDMIAGAVSRMPYYIVDAEENDVTDELTPRYWKELTYKLCASLLIFNGAYCLKETNQFGMNAKWRFLPSPLMSYHTTPKNEIDYFEYRSGASTERIADFEKRLLWWWWPNLQSEIGPGAGPMNAALGDIGLSSSLTKFAEAYFARGGFPLTLLQGPNLGPGVGEKVLSWWNSMIAGAKRAFRAIILDEKIKVNTIGTSIKDTIAPELYMQAAHNVAIAFGIPLSLLMSDAANYATALEDHVRFYTETVIPIHERMIEVWNERVYEPRGYTIEGNPDDLEIMQSYQLQQAAAVMALVGKPILTLDEGREMLGYEPLGKDSVEPPAPEDTSTTPAADVTPAQDAQPDAERDDAISNERKRLKRYAHNRITDGKPFKFTSDVIGLPEIESVKALATHEAIDALDLGAIVGTRRDDLSVLIETINAARAELRTATKGGPGSGNFGHAGRPGEVGGSSQGGGVGSSNGDDSGSVIGSAEGELSSLSYSDNERAIVVSSGGRKLLDKRGRQNEVEFTDDEVSQMNGATLTHSHPNGSSFSEGDIELARLANLSEIRVVGVGSDFTYSITRTNSGKPWPSKYDIREAWKDAETPHYYRIASQVAAGTKGKEEAHIELSHAVWVDIAKDSSMNLTYSRFTRK